MTSRSSFAFRIDSLSRGDVPMRDLAAYMTDLVQLLGHYDAIRFLDVRDGSLELRYEVEDGAVGDVDERVKEAQASTGDPTARRAYRNLDRRLKKHRSSAAILRCSGSREGRAVLEIPGALDADTPIPAVWSEGRIDGIPTGIGGKQVDPDWMLVRLHDAGASLRCEARPPVALAIGRYLLKKPIRATGRGRWIRDEDDGWSLDRFQIEAFEELDDRSLAEIVPELRDVYKETEWADMEDPVGSLARLRDSR